VTRAFENQGGTTNPAARAKPWSEQGQDAAEFALILPILFLILMGMFDMGRAVYYTSTLNSAAREGARYASVHPTDTAGIEAAVDYIAVGIAPDDLTITTTLAPGGAYDVVQVAVTYNMPIVTPLIGGFFGGDNEVTLGSQASMKTELRLP
jgi:Flp pilus assembly protein TadG